MDKVCQDAHVACRTAALVESALQLELSVTAVNMCFSIMTPDAPLQQWPCPAAEQRSKVWPVQLLHTCAELLVLLCWVQVEAQIEEVSASVDAATKALPQLSKEQQAAQVGVERHSCCCANYTVSLP
jgi:hypothetical protein